LNAPAADAGPGCASCGGCCSGACVPGRFRECCGCNRDTICGRLFCGFYEELCCPDPCYEGKWLPVANAAFFVEGTRPVTTTRIRYNYDAGWAFPDRNEFLWARIGKKGPKNPENTVDVHEFSIYQEIAAKGFSAT